MVRACGGVLNPWNHRPTPRNRRIVVVVIALSAIAAVAGALVLPQAFSGSIGRFHTFATFPKWGALSLTISGAAFAILGFAWLGTNRPPQPHSFVFPLPPDSDDLSHHTGKGLVDYAPTANLKTLIQKPFLANRILDGAYLIGKRPDGWPSDSVTGLIAQEEVGIVIRLAPNSPQPGEVSGAGASDAAPPIFSLEKTTTNPRHTVVSFNLPCVHRCALAMQTIATLRNQLDTEDQRPLLILAADEKESGAFALLYELAKHADDARKLEIFMGTDFERQVRNLAAQIEYDSFRGAATDWLERVLPSDAPRPADSNTDSPFETALQTYFATRRL